MQALIATSRSVTQDLFLQRENDRKYKQHLSKVSSIRQFRQFPTLEQAKQTDRLTKTIYKHKQAAKTFRDKQDKIQIKRENRVLLQKIWKMSSHIQSDSNVMHLQHQSGSNWTLKKKQAELIKEENKRLGINLMSSKADVKEYKKKMEMEIKEYLELRKNIRKVNTESERNRKHSRAKSEKRVFSIKLRLKEGAQENKQVEDNTKEVKLMTESLREQLPEDQKKGEIREEVLNN